MIHDQLTPLNQLFQLHYDGLGTFLGIAGARIADWAADGSLQAGHIAALRAQSSLALQHTGKAFELLAMERLDYTDTDRNSTLCTSLMMAGRIMQEMADINDSLRFTENRLQHSATGDNADWPDC